MSDTPSADTPESEPAQRPSAWLLLAWIVAAFVSALCGIGGGLFAVPMLHFIGRLPLKRAIGTALVLVFIMATTATVAEALRADSALDVRVALLLVAGSLLGAQLGFRVAQRIKVRLLKLSFIVVLLIAGLRILFSEGSGAVPGAELEWTASTAALVGGIGFCGGFLSPLLGIGGGLVVVPALFFSLPSFGHLDARANSMAMGAVASAWSAWLHFRAGGVHGPTAAWFSASTVVGAVLGVMLVHRDGWADMAQLLMGGVLLFVAARFARDVLGGR